MRADSEAILLAISELTQRVDSRFDRMDERFDHINGRVRKSEQEITKIKTAGSVVAAALTFIGWEHIKPWLTALTR